MRAYCISSLADRPISAPGLQRRKGLPLALLFAAGLLAALLALLGGTQPARAASFVVTKTADTADGACDADCSLREAIIAANADPGHDTITLSPGVFTLSRLGRNEDRADTGDLDIFADLTLIGAGADLSIVDGLGLGGVTDRVFDIYADGWAEAATTVRIAGITIRNGRVDEEPGSCRLSGGGIRARDAVLTLESVVVINNRTDSTDCALIGQGGGLYFEQARFPATLMITDTQIVSNTAGYGGGGVYVWQYWGVSAPLTMTLTNSRVMSNTVESGAGPAFGGGIYFSGDSETHPATLTVWSSTVAGNRAYGTEGFGGSGFTEGGGIRFGSYGRLIIHDSAITDNSALGNSSSYIVSTGGGVHFWNASGEGALRIENSVIERNVSHNGGGLYVLADQNSASVNNSSINANRAVLNAGGDGGSGGGIYGDLQLTAVTLRDNTAAKDGGGVYSGAYGGSPRITDSVIADNIAGGNGGGLSGTGQVVSSTITGNRAANGGGINAGAIEIIASTISANTAITDGGGIYVPNAYRGGPIVNVTNSTLSGNSAGRAGGAFSDRGGLSVTERFISRAHFRNTSIVGNTAPAGSGGGLFHFGHYGSEEGPQLLTMEAVLLADNTGGNCGGAISAEGFTSRGHNLSSDGACPALTQASDLKKIAAKVGPLQANGGPTLTRALLDGSPAIDAGGAANCLPTDQRGVSRPQGTACDIGAYEWQPTTPYLAMAPTALTFVAVPGAQPPPPQPFTITNTGLGALAWTATENTAWLSVSPGGGAAPASPVVSVNHAGLPVGVYTGTITVAAAGAGGSPQTVTVTLHVVEVQNIIGNWDFELGRVAWTESSTTMWQLIRPAEQFEPPITPHAGAWAALLGVNDGEISDLSQQIALPTGVSLTLTFYYYAVSVETDCTYDTVQMRLDNAVIDQIGLCQANNTNGWRQRRVELGRFDSPTLPVLRFRAVNDPSSDPSTFALDDVRLEAREAPPPVYDHVVYLPAIVR